MARLVLALLILLLPALGWSATFPICGDWRIETESRIRFTPVEKEFVCGSADIEAWKRIPRAQAEYHLGAFLQERGFYFPEFVTQDAGILVRAGKKTRVTGITVTGSPPATLRIAHRRGVRRQVLTPSLLTNFEGWVRSQLQSQGYPCPTVTTTADARTGQITLHVDPGLFSTVIDIAEEPIPGLKDGVLRRFDAFQIGKPYDQRWTALTTRRVDNDGIVSSAYFIPRCSEDGVHLKQDVISGKRRLFVIGFGASTEEYAIIKAAWQQMRIGELASSVRIAGYASYRKQRLRLDAAWYVLPTPSRWYLKPMISTQRHDESQYEYLSTQVGFQPAVNWDTQNTSISFAIGPISEFTHTYRGDNKGNAHFMTLAASLAMATHDFEFYDSDPRSGFAFTIATSLAARSIGSSTTAQRFAVEGEWLLNLGRLDPPLFVIGLRGRAATTLADRGNAAFQRLPPDYQQYLGGAATLRGFKRKSVPQNPKEALTSIYTGVELRLAHLLPAGIQPLVFSDFGVMGTKSFDLEEPIYWSPGFGVRLASIIGVIRFTASRGYVFYRKSPLDGSDGWRFILSFGEEF